jgi:hypothetical protein
MNKLTPFAALIAVILVGSLPECAWPEDSASSGSAPPAGQATAPAGAVAPGYAQPWQPPNPWQVPQPMYGQPLYGQPRPYYPPGGQFPPFPAWPAAAPAARMNPDSAGLKQAREQLEAKTTELNAANGQLEQVRGKLEECLAAQSKLSDKVTYDNREQNALRVRVTELVKSQNTANATLEQQHQLIAHFEAQTRDLTTERDQLQHDLQAATQALEQATAQASIAREALSAARTQIGAHRAELTRLDAELQKLQERLQGTPQHPADAQTPTE